MKFNISAFLAVLSALLSVTTGNAQQAEIAKSTSSRQAQWRYIRNAEEFRSVDLTALPRLPDLPGYTGRSYLFVAGQEFPNMRTGRVVNLEFCTLEGPAVVSQWYRTVLPQYGWTMEPAASTSLKISARKDNKSCRVSVSDTGEEGYAGQVTIIYKEDKG
jgi:hypothetical protein